MKKPRLSKKTIEKLIHGYQVKRGNYIYSTDTQWNEELNAYEETLYRWDKTTGTEESWTIGWQGLYEFEVDRND